MSPPGGEPQAYREEEEANTESVPPGTVGFGDTAGAHDDGRAALLPANESLSPLIFQFPFDQGGTGEIWQAIQSSLKRIVAVKRILPDQYARNQHDSLKIRGIEKRFREEARITASLEHPNIVPVYDLRADENGHPLLMMKLVNGAPWLKLLRHDMKHMSYESYLAKHLPIFVSTMQAVAFAHSKGVLHLDLKPSQVMVGEFGEILLMDWGMAMSVDALPNGGRLPVPAGTPVMMSPEQAGAEDFPIGFHTDIYLLGGTLYFILTNRYPHEANNTPKAVELARAGKVTPPQNLVTNIEVPLALSELALRCMSYNPADRPLAVSDLIQDIQNYLSGAETRNEALQIVSSVRQSFAAMESETLVGASDASTRMAETYDQLAYYLSRLSYAEGLWRRTAGLQELRDEVASRYVEVALGAGDLRLAQITTTTVQDERRKARLGFQVRQARQALRRRQLIGRSALAASVVLALMLFGGTVRYALDIRKATQRLALEKDIAEQAREMAEWAFAKAESERLAVEAARDRAEQEQYLASIRLIERNVQDLRIREAENELGHIANHPLRGPEWGLLATRVGANLMTLWRVDPPARLHFAEFSPDDQLIATGDNYGYVMIWDAKNGRRLREANVSSLGLWNTIFSPDGSRIVATSFDGVARILDSESLQVIHELRGHTELLRGAAISPDGNMVITTSQDAKPRAWDMNTGEMLWVARGVLDRTSSARFSPDGKTFVLGGSIYFTLRDSSDGSVIFDMTGATENILDVDFSPDGRTVVSASTDRNIRLYDTSTGALKLTIPNRTSWLHSVHFHPDGRRLISSDNDGTVRIWDYHTGEMLRQFNGPTTALRVRFSRDGSKAVVSSSTQITLWSTDGFSGEVPLPELSFSGSRVQANTVIKAFGTPLEYRVARGEAWNTARFLKFQAPNGDVVMGHSHYYAPSPDGTRGIFINPPDGSAEIVIIGSEEEPVQLEGGPFYVIRWLPQGDRFIAATYGGEVTVWNASTLTPERQLLPGGLTNLRPGEYSASFDISQDQSTLAIVRADLKVHLYEAATLNKITSFDYNDGSPAYISLSRDGALVAIGGHSFRSRIFDTKTGRQVAVTAGHEAVVSGAVFWHDASRLISWGADKRVLMHELPGGREVMTIANIVEREAVIGLGISPNWSAIYMQMSNLQVYHYPILTGITSELHGDQRMSIARQLEAYKRSRHLGMPFTAADIDWDVPTPPVRP